METSELYVPREFYISYDWVSKIIKLIEDRLPSLDLPKTDEKHLDIIKTRISKEDYGDTYLQDLLACHFVIDSLMKNHKFKDKYYIWLETTDSDKYPTFRKNIDISVPVGSCDELGRIRFGQVMTICIRLKSTMLKRIKYNLELGIIQYNSINNVE